MTVTQLASSEVGKVDAAIVTHGLTKVYPGDIRAVDALDLTVERGEIFGLLGPNGAGKTTTAGMLTTRVIPTAGTAFVGGVDVIHHPSEAKRLIGVVPQTNTLDRSLTVWENLYFHGRFFGMPAKAAKGEATRLLEQFRLAERAKAQVLALSGGMAQRLMVARAVMHRPSVLFLDEPTAGLDPQSRIALVGDPRRVARRRADDPAHDALHGRSGPIVQPGRDHRQGCCHRARYAPRTEALASAPIARCASSSTAIGPNSRMRSNRRSPKSSTRR